MFTQVAKAFLSKAVDYIAENALTNVEDIMGYDSKSQLILEALEKNWKALSAKASDFVEEIKSAELSGRKKRKREVEEWIEEVRTIEKEIVELGSQVESQEFIRRLMDGGKGAKLNDQVEKLLDQSQNFGELVLDVRGIRGDPFLTNRLVGEAFHQNVEAILKHLESGQVSSIGVYGMGGVGKTTLAKHIYNRLLEQSQGRVFWITVSQEFTMKSLQDKIARLMGVDLSDENEEDRRAVILNVALSRMANPLIILDDVWEKIDMLKVGFRVSVDCCRLIITTRSLKVCRQIGCQIKIPLEILQNDEPWELFNETLGNDERQLGPEVEEIAKSMAAVCNGLPLGIITVAGSMRGETSIHTWKDALVDLKKFVVGGDEVFKVLKYSFDRLKTDQSEKNDQLGRNHQSQSNEFNTLQLCFLYCSLYPEDWKIPKKELVGKLISEGLMDAGKSRRQKIDKGHSTLDTLANVCLLESCYDNKFVKMHDLVRDMALKICEGKYMVRAGNHTLKDFPGREEWTEGLEKVSLMMHNIGFGGVWGIGDVISPDCPKLSTLLLPWNNKMHCISDSFFSKMQGLCTLDLSHTDIRKLPDSICDIKSLKALLLRDCLFLREVPNLGSLTALRELDLSLTLIKEVPQGVEELLNLEVLSMDAIRLKMIPSGLFLKLRHLQLVELPFHINVSMEEFKNLKQVEEFSGGLKNVSGFNRFITSQVNDICYRIVIGSSDYDLDFRDEKERGFRLDTKELMLNKCDLKDEKVLWQGVVYLIMEDCKGLCICSLDDSSELNYPTSLKRLKVDGCRGIEWIWRSNQQGLPSHFSTLEEIGLWGLKDLKGLIQKGEIGAAAPAQPLFSFLKKLKIVFCDKMRKVGLLVRGFPNLESIYIGWCEEIEEIFEDEGTCSLTLPRLRYFILNDLPKLRKVGLPSGVPNLHHISIQRCPKLRKLGLSALEIPNLERIETESCDGIEEILGDEGSGPVSLPKLKELRLSSLPSLKSICKGMMIYDSIKEICIKGCPILRKKLPLHVGVAPPATLTQIMVEREWWESLEWDNPNIPQLLQPFLKFEDQ